MNNSLFVSFFYYRMYEIIVFEVILDGLNILDTKVYKTTKTIKKIDHFNDTLIIKNKNFYL